jgi:opacity protein-like surface antigen
MICTRLTISTLVTAAALAAGVAHAADYSPPPPPAPPPPCCDNWYLRGDIGFSNQQVGSLFNENYNRFASVQNVDKSFDAAPLFGIGVGYNVNNWLRFDVTGEYRAKANFHGLDITSGPNQDDRYTASKYEWTFLFNGYVDLGTWYCFTPFIGAGVGATRNTITNFGDSSEAVGGDSHSTTDFSKWNLAWALYAGVGYKVTDNLTLELSYRYIDLGNAKSGTMVDFTGNNFDTPFEFRHLTSNDVRLGLRFTCCDFAPPPPPPPLQTRG